MHKNGVLGLDKAPGRSWRPPPTLEQLKPGILRKLWAFEVMRQRREQNLRTRPDCR